MTTQRPHGPRCPSARLPRRRKPMAWRFVLLGALTGSLGLGVVLSATAVRRTAAPAPLSGARAVALATSSLVGSVEGAGGPWVP